MPDAPLRLMLGPAISARDLKRGQREHAGLRADYTRRPWWAFWRTDFYTVSCSCGWVDPKPVQAIGTEFGGSWVTDLGLNLAMNRHLEAVYGRADRG